MNRGLGTDGKAGNMRLHYLDVRKMLQRYQINEAVAYGKAIVPCLIKALDDKNRDVRAAAAEALGEMDDDRAIPALIKALGDASVYVGETARDALVYIGRQTVPALLEALESNEYKIRKGAAESLVRINEPSIAALTNALGANIKNKKEKAAKLLLTITDSKIAANKKQMIRTDGELLEGETVKPPKKKRIKNKTRNKNMPKLINIHGNRSRII